MCVLIVRGGGAATGRLMCQWQRLRVSHVELLMMNLTAGRVVCMIIVIISVVISIVIVGIII